ncbi:carotenoid cleavage dioxygenase 1 [Nannizzia gypsea CBS 118893]|uniref:Carotenoid cleavage dioxygenase 1 n=1 Tax=Arthroderma gypseum (strain ATCC MYA-4604 / CBS 118893) TaxID=535722 RepID=E4UPP4_ARTGP|nr:carotenoid cleavage dioxygenase 1 [Nannizzia gypsea CBS 118893]EFQ99081.1 carotenoid cleavage dioxygenase 1 [Nannizzia gypsea CBS 118893]
MDNEKKNSGAHASKIPIYLEEFVYQIPTRYLHGNFAPIHSTCPPTPCCHTGDIPEELNGGQYVRNGGNPLMNHDLGRDTHWFDGDGMLSGVFFRKLNGKAVQPEFVNNYVLTDILLASRANPRLRWPILPSVATLINPRSSIFRIAYFVCRALLLVIWSCVNGSKWRIKKISVVNTSVIYHDGRALATCESGPPMRVSLPELNTVGWFNGLRAEGEPEDPRSASHIGFGGPGFMGFLRKWTTGHPKVDPISRELILYHSTFVRPFVHYSVIPDSGAQGNSIEQSPLFNLPVPGVQLSKMMHDFGVSRQHTIIIDLPLSLDPMNLAYNKPVIAYDRYGRTRFGIFPRHTPNQVRWFETEPCCIFHTVNSWDDSVIDKGTTVNMLACRMTSAAIVFSTGNIQPPANLRNIEDECRLYYYQFDLSQVENIISHQWALSAITFEFPHVPKHLAMSATQFVYGCTMSKGSFSAALGRAAKIDGLAKLDVKALVGKGLKTPPPSVTGSVDSRSVQEILASNDPDDPIKIFQAPPGWYLQECCFIPRANGVSEDDGWLLTFVFDESQLDEDGSAPAGSKSELWILDAKTMCMVTRIYLPQRVPYGLHGWWFSEEDVCNQRAVERCRSE